MFCCYWTVGLLLIDVYLNAENIPGSGLVLPLSTWNTLLLGSQSSLYICIIPLRLESTSQKVSAAWNMYFHMMHHPLKLNASLIHLLRQAP
ncbi:hypothetical protein BDQ17DRAFT_459029 [Cyathus striatus]|nr:hypothetical protein BDQ17DRAFT_459029 [Cyathus striatus]